MVLTAVQHASVDRLVHAHVIRETFARSPLFREAALSELVLTPEGDVVVNISFDGGPAIFRVVAGSEAETYAVLHELARTMVEIEQEQGLDVHRYARTRGGGEITAAHCGEGVSHENEGGSRPCIIG
jgi:hypothetical protein